MTAHRAVDFEVLGRVREIPQIEEERHLPRQPVLARISWSDRGGAGFAGQPQLSARDPGTCRTSSTRMQNIAFAWLDGVMSKLANGK